MKVACRRQNYVCIRIRVLIGSAILATIGATAPNARLAAQSPTTQSPKPAEPTSTSGKPKFDITSVKPNKSAGPGGYQRYEPGGLYRATDTVRALIASAYQDEFPPKGELVFGGPDWIDSEHFDIEARAEANTSRDSLQLMVQSLLEDRFKLVVHHEMRLLPLYELVVVSNGKLGPQLTEHAADSKCADSKPGKPLPQPAPGEPMPAYCGGFFMSPRPGDLRETGNAVTMDQFSTFMGQSVDRKVLNRTGLSGAFDLALEFAPEVGPGSQISTTNESDASGPPSIFTALQQQLGLKLNSTKGPVDVILIDHVEEPTPN